MAFRKSVHVLALLALASLPAACTAEPAGPSPVATPNVAFPASAVQACDNAAVPAVGCEPAPPDTLAITGDCRAGLIIGGNRNCAASGEVRTPTVACSADAELHGRPPCGKVVVARCSPPEEVGSGDDPRTATGPPVRAQPGAASGEDGALECFPGTA